MTCLILEKTEKKTCTFNGSPPPSPPPISISLTVTYQPLAGVSSPSSPAGTSSSLPLVVHEVEPALDVLPLAQLVQEVDASTEL
jgi:hypothetical protein